MRIFTFSLILITHSIAHLLNAGKLYVSKSGDDTNPGTKEAPLLTIQKAADVAKPGDTVYVYEGTYRETVRPANSGKKDAPILYKAIDGENVTISGAELVSDWEPYEGAVWSAQFADTYKSKYNYSLQVFQNGEMLHLARSPNIDDISRPKKFEVEKVLKAKMLKKNAKDDNGIYSITISNDELHYEKDTLIGAKIDILATQHWGWGMPNTGTIIANKPGQLTYEIGRYKHDPDNKGSQSVRPDTYFHIYNAKDLLDIAGEWLYDRSHELLLLNMPDLVDPNEHTIEIRQRDFAFDLSERSYITIDGFKLFAATITTDVESGTGIPELYPDYQIRMDVAPSHNITIQNINAKYPTHFTDMRGYVLSQWTNNTGIVLSGSDHTLKDSVIGYSAGNGVTVMGERHKVLNNIIHNTSYSAAETGAVAAGTFKTRSVDHEIAHNTMYTIGGNGMWVNALTSTKPKKYSTRIHHNSISDVGIQRRDIGYIYAAGHIPKGVRFDHNIMWGISSQLGFGIYIDYSHDWLIHNNLVTDTPWAMCLHAGERNKVYNNTLIGLTQAIVAHPHESNKGTDVRNNLLLGKVAELNGARVRKNEIIDNLSTFVQPEALNYQLVDSSPYIDKGTKIKKADIESVMKPDLGAYEHGLEPWTAGSTLPPIVAAPTHMTATRNGNTITLNWQDNADNEKTYILERGHHAGEWDRIDWEIIRRLPENTTTYTDTLPDLKTTYYRVRSPESTLSNLAYIKIDEKEQNKEGSPNLNDMTAPE